MNVNGEDSIGSYPSTDGDTAGITELQQKTQNIDLATTTSTVTNFLGELKLNGTDISGGGGGGGIEVGSKADLLAKTGMTEGQQFYVNANLGQLSLHKRTNYGLIQEGHGKSSVKQ